MISHDIYLSLTSCSMIISRFICVATNGIISSFFMVEWFSIVYMYHMFIYSSVNGHLDCFHVLGIVNAAMNIWMHISF